MNWNYQADASRSVIFVTAEGLITQEELSRGAATLCADPIFRPDIRVLLDFSQATDWDLRADKLSELGGLRRFSPRSRRAIVLPEGLPKAMFYFHKLSAHPGTVELFSSRDEAVAWLNQGTPPEKVIT